MLTNLFEQPIFQTLMKLAFPFVGNPPFFSLLFLFFVLVVVVNSLGFIFFSLLAFSLARSRKNEREISREKQEEKDQ